MSRGPVLVLMVPLLLVAGAVTYAVVHASGLPEGPVEVVWDKEACAHCRMHVGEPGFAAQLQTKSGDVLSFDDPGCLIVWMDRNHPEVHAIWFRHLEEDRWIPADKVRFRHVSPTPMGYGLGAVDVDEPDTIDWEQARTLVRGTPGGNR